MIRIVIEFFRLEKVRSKGDKKEELFPTGESAPTFNEGLKTALENASGVYIFFDSRGQPVYVGQARRNLWTESKSAFNRDLGENQSRKVNLVKHPPRSAYQEKERRIRPTVTKIHDMAAYFSAYEVEEEHIDDIEALLVRVCTNITLNLQNPKFGRSKRQDTDKS